MTFVYLLSWPLSWWRPWLFSTRFRFDSMAAAATTAEAVLDVDGCGADCCCFRFVGGGDGSTVAGSAMDVPVDFFLLFDRWRNSFRKIVADGRQLRRGQQQQVERSSGGPEERGADVFELGLRWISGRKDDYKIRIGATRKTRKKMLGVVL